jgi:hypothetical protein
MTTLELRTPAEVNSFIQATTNSINSAGELLQSIANALELATTLAKEPQHITSLQLAIDSYHSQLCSLLESAKHGQVHIYSGQLLNSTLAIGTPAKSMDISIPLLSLETLGLSYPIRLSETVEAFPLISCSAMPDHCQLAEYGRLEPVFRQSLAIHFNAFPGDSIPLPKGTTALELSEIINRHVDSLVFDWLAPDAINFYFGGQFDPMAHVDMLNQLTTIDKLSAKIALAQQTISGLRATIESLASQALSISEAQFRSQGTSAESLGTAKPKSIKTLID